MIKFYYSLAPNPRKVALMLEESGLPYEPLPVDSRKGEQHLPAYTAINPNAKVPAIVDDGTVVFDSSAILLYLAEKTGRFLAPSGPARYAALQWLTFQMSAVGPVFGQCYHFRTDAEERIPYAVERFTNEARKLYAVIDRRLAETSYLAGDEYGIADMATFPWAHGIEKQGHDPARYPNVVAWWERVRQRPAVRRGVKVLSDSRRLEMNAAEREVLFGATQHAGPA